MAGNTSANGAATLIDGSFCDTFLNVAGILAYVAAAFLIAGLLVGLAAAIAGIIRGPTKPDSTITRTSEAFLEALKGLIEALTAAPAWLGMFGAGIALFWAIAEVGPQKCKDLAANVAEPPKAPAKPNEAPPMNSQGN